jgi:hypothetical protein
MDMVSTHDNNTNLFNMNNLSNFEGMGLLNIMNSDENIHQYVEQNMGMFIQHFISRRPYEQFLWEIYQPLTIDQFKTNLQVQEFVSSNEFEQNMEPLIGEEYTSYDIRGCSNEKCIYGTFGMNNERKLLFGMLLHNNNYLENSPNTGEYSKLKCHIYSFDSSSNDVIKYFIKVITICPKMAKTEYCEQDIIYIAKEEDSEEFINYLIKLSSYGALASDIKYTYTCFDEDAIELFEEYCRDGMWSEHAKEFAEDDIEMTPSRKYIYSKLIGRVNYDVLYESIENDRVRNLRRNPLTVEEQKTLDSELRSHNYMHGITH